MRYFSCLLLWLGLLAGALSAQTEQTQWIGKIAYVGEDYNVYTYFASVNYALTQDGNNTRRYQWLTWSNDDQLAYFCCSLDVARDLRTAAYLSENGLLAGRVVWTGFGTQVIYAAWSPAPCAEESHCRPLSLLLNDVLRGVLRVALLQERSESDIREIEVGKGAPFYYSFSADGSQIVLHRNNRDIDIYDVAAQDLVVRRARRSSGTFQTPSWSPVDNRIVIGTRGSNRQLTNITLVDEQGGTRTLVTDVRGNISFLWSPDGRYLAVSSSNISALFVVDVASGNVVARSPIEHVMAFFWSPDSRYLAYVTPYRLNGGFSKPNTRQLIQQRRATLSWSVLDVIENNSVLLAPFVPTYETSYLLTYFDQFAQSHRVWSPDSRHLVYAEEVNGVPTVQVLDAMQSSVPATLARGRYAVWSFR